MPALSYSHSAPSKVSQNRTGQSSQCIRLAWVLTEARVSLQCFQSEWKGQVWLFYNEQRWSIYLCWLKFPLLSFHLSARFAAEKSFQRIQKWWLQEPIATQLCAFFQASYWRKEQLEQICILWLIPGGSQITDSIWMFKLNLCWDLLPSSLLLVFNEGCVPLMCWMQFWLLFYLGVWWARLSSCPKLLIIGSCWDLGLNRNFCMWMHAVPAESCSEMDNTNLRKQLHSNHSWEGSHLVSWKCSWLYGPAPRSALESNYFHDL